MNSLQIALYMLWHENRKSAGLVWTDPHSTQMSPPCWQLPAYCGRNACRTWLHLSLCSSTTVKCVCVCRPNSVLVYEVFILRTLTGRTGSDIINLEASSYTASGWSTKQFDSRFFLGKQHAPSLTVVQIERRRALMRGEKNARHEPAWVSGEAPNMWWVDSLANATKGQNKNNHLPPLTKKLFLCEHKAHTGQCSTAVSSCQRVLCGICTHA